MPAADARSPILVTGGSGFIGAAIARRLAAEGHRVATLDLPGRAFPYPGAQGIEPLEGDVTARGDVDRALGRSAPSVIVHAAAVMGAPSDPRAFGRVNVGGSETVADAASAAGVGRVIYLSSVTVHGLPAARNVPESAPLRPAGMAYAESKIAAEAALRRRHQSGSISLTILRPGDVYGPRSHEWVVKLVDALRARRMIYISGGSGLVNVTYVENLCDAVLACLASPSSAGATYNITDGEPVTWRRYLTALAEACSAPPPSISIPAAVAWPIAAVMEAALPPLGIRPPLGRLGLRILTARCSYSIEAAKRDLGWAPAVGFEEGMRHVAAWVAEAMPPGAVPAPPRR